MFKSRKLSIVVLGVFFLSVLTGFGAKPASAAIVPTDIAGNWASAQIISLFNQGVVSGYADGTFRPNNSISRVEFIIMINRAFNFTVPASITYSDVKPTDWFYLEIAKAKAAGYIAGYSDGTMRPNNKISREEAAVILAQVLGLRSSDSGLSFSDAAKIQNWSWAAISSMVEAGYISGYPDGTFRPANSISRAEAAAMIFASKSRVLVTGVSLNKTSTTIGIGKSETLLATVSPANASNTDVTWLSSNSAVATVSSTGVVYGKGKGTATIMVTADRGKVATCTVTVKDIVEVTKVSLDESSITLDIDEDVTLEATITPSDATNKDLIWTSSDEDIATVSSSGKVTAQDEGNCTIKAMAKDGSGAYDTCKVTVSDGSNSGDMELSEDSIEMDTDDSVTVKVYMPDDYDTSYVESVDDPEIDGDDWIIDDITWSDVDDYEDYVKFTIYSNDDDEEGDATITFAIQIDGEWYYSDELEVTVGSGSGDDDISVSPSSFSMGTDRYRSVTVQLPDDYLGRDVDDHDWDISSGDSEIIDHVTYSGSVASDYVTFRIYSSDEEGDCIVTLSLTVDGYDYEADVDVTVAD